MKLFNNHIINTLLTRFLIAFCLMGIVIITSQILGAEGRGVISYVLLLITIAQVIAEFVGGSALINLAPRIRLLNLVWPAYLFSFIVTVMLFFILNSATGQLVPAWLTSVIALFLCLSNINLNLILGRQQINQRNGIQFVYTLLLLSGVYYVYWVQEQASILPYFHMLALSYIIGFVLSSAQLLKLQNKDTKEPLRLTREVFKYGFWSQLAQLINLLNYRVAYFFVESDFGLEQLGIYGNAMTVGDMMKIPGQSLGQVQHNRIINNNDSGSFGEIITGRYLTLNLILYLAQAAVILLLPAFFWTWLLGADFSSLKQVVLYLLPGFIALGVATSFSYYFHAINRFKTVMVVNVITFISFVMGYILLAPSFHFRAVLLSFSLAYILQLICFIILFFGRKGRANRFNPLLDMKFWIKSISNKD